VNGRCRRLYIGKGPLADLAGAEDARRRAERRAAKAALRAALAHWESVDGPLRELDAAVDLLVRVALTVAGYRRHDRGAWRRRRQ
jgi:hypothetical protein